MKKYITYAAFLFAVSTALMACDQNKGSDAATPVPSTCVAPNYINASGVCVNANGIVIGGSGPATYVDSKGYMSINGGWSMGSMQITDTAAYKEFLKTAMAVCDRFSNSNRGYYSYDSYTNGTLSIQVQVAALTANAATLQISAQQGYYDSYFSSYVGVQTPLPVQNPIYLPNSPLSVINNYAGFDIRRTVNLNHVQLIVRNGKLGDATLVYELAYGSQAINPTRVFATGTLTRTQ